MVPFASAFRSHPIKYEIGLKAKFSSFQIWDDNFIMKASASAGIS
jgi:hypothetical protein